MLCTYMLVGYMRNLKLRTLLSKTLPDIARLLFISAITYLCFTNSLLLLYELFF